MLLLHWCGTTWHWLSTDWTVAWYRCMRGAWLERAGAWKCMGLPPSASECVGLPSSAWPRQIWCTIDQEARGGVSDIHFWCGLMLKFCLEERNTLVLSEIYFKYFYKHLNFDMGFDTNCCVQNESPITHTKDNRDLRDSSNDAYGHRDKLIIH